VSDSVQHIAALAAADVVAATGDDAALANQAAQGDQDAFARIMRRYNQRLYRVAIAVMGDASEAEDVLQESYVRAFYSLATYTGAGSLGGWLARIVRNEAIDRLRARESRRSHIAIEADLGEQGEQPHECSLTKEFKFHLTLRMRSATPSGPHHDAVHAPCLGRAK